MLAQGDGPILLVTHDGAARWQAMPVLVPIEGGQLGSVEFVTPNLGWGRVGTWGGPAVTTDGGRTWRQLPLEISPGPTEATPPTTTIGETLVDDPHTAGPCRPD